MSLETKLLSEVHEIRSTVDRLDTTIRDRGGVLDRLDEGNRRFRELEQSQAETRAQLSKGLTILGTVTGTCAFFGPKILGAIWKAVFGS